MDADDDPSVVDVYDAIAEGYAEGYWEENPYQADMEFPGTTDLIPDVSDCRVLDAGCGSGVYTEWLLDRGADVVAVDLSENMLEQTADLVGERATLYQADLSDPLEFAADDEFDGIVSGSVIDHVEDWHRLFAEFARVLSPGGFFVFSIRHPMQNLLEFDDWGYFDVERRITDWGIDTPHYTRPLSGVLNPLAETGFHVEEVAEPKPTAAFREKLPEDYQTLQDKPYWLCLRARRAQG